ncbi:MAG: FHA domain-containing protein [Gammaproteobacteria bacterium]|nr:FHA domain-containing protein [Gammaproteobacteria bacterium]
MPKLTLSFKGRVIDVFHIEAGETRIGRDPECEITIDSLAIAPINVLIKSVNHSCSLESLDEEFPILVNHKQEETARLQHGDVIQVGKHTLSFSEDALDLGSELHQTGKEAEHPADAVAEDAEEIVKGMLQIMNGEKFGRIIPLTQNMTRIGRTGGHCAMIARRESGYFISYLEGPSSPTVNNTPIGDETQLLNDGDLIEVGSTQLQFHV